jgi:hypothetical protein
MLSYSVPISFHPRPLSRHKWEDHSLAYFSSLSSTLAGLIENSKAPVPFALTFRIGVQNGVYLFGPADAQEAKFGALKSRPRRSFVRLPALRGVVVSGGGGRGRKFLEPIGSNAGAGGRVLVGTFGIVGRS